MWRASTRTTTFASRPRLLLAPLTRTTAIMPPKRTASKRKAEAASDDEGEYSKASKKHKVAAPAPTTDGGLAANGQPTNKVLPTSIAFAPKNEGTIRISTWNVCGLAAASKKVTLTRHR